VAETTEQWSSGPRGAPCSGPHQEGGVCKDPQTQKYVYKTIITTARKVKSCKEMGGATSVMPVIRDAFSASVVTCKF